MEDVDGSGGHDGRPGGAPGGRQPLPEADRDPASFLERGPPSLSWDHSDQPEQQKSFQDKFNQVRPVPAILQ